jgi:hypothetical protein
MIQIDGVSSMGLTMDNILSMDRTRVSDVKLFSVFAEGIKIDDEFLFSERWAPSDAIPHSSTIDLVMFEMLPAAYDVDVLEKMGGCLGFRITDVGDYALISLNNRVVTLSGLPIAFETNSEILNCEISRDVFMGFCRGLLLDVADNMLEKDDEFENRRVSDGELIFNGMPSGGNEPAGRDFGASMTSVRAQNIGTVNSLGEAIGSISHSNDEDWIAVRLDSQSTYTVILQGDTLQDPYLRGIYNAGGERVHVGNDDGGVGLNSQLNFTPSESGVYYVSAGAYGSSTGTYALLVKQATSIVKCGAAYSITSGSSATVSISACGAAASATGITAGAIHVSAVGAGVSAIGVFGCVTNAFGCGVVANAISAFGCAANIYGCYTNAFAAEVHGCGANASVCVAAAGLAVISGCGANASACGVAFSTGGLIGCGANASACGVDVGFAPCAAYSVACGVDLGVAFDVGACAINLFPVLPSC